VSIVEDRLHGAVCDPAARWTARLLGRLWMRSSIGMMCPDHAGPWERSSTRLGEPGEIRDTLVFTRKVSRDVR
jgi:hypothetical protein